MCRDCFREARRVEREGADEEVVDVEDEEASGDDGAFSETSLSTTILNGRTKDLPRTVLPLDW